MNTTTLHAHIEQVRRDRPGPLRVLVLHDGASARQRVKRLLLRIQGCLVEGMQTECDYQRIAAASQHPEIMPPTRVELVLLAVSCSATLTPETLDALIAQLPALKANDGALAFLSGTVVPRQLDVLLVDQFLRMHAKRVGVDFFSGTMPGLGCPGCFPPGRKKPARPGPRRYCVLHAPQPGRSPSRRASNKVPTATKAKTARVGAARSRQRSNRVARPQFHRRRSRKEAAS